MSTTDGVGLKITCKHHGGRLFYAWRDTNGEVFYNPHKGALPTGWGIDDRGPRRLATIRCTRPGCRQQQAVSHDWIDEHLRMVAEAYDAGIGPRVVSFPLSEVGAPRGALRPNPQR